MGLSARAGPSEWANATPPRAKAPTGSGSVPADPAPRACRQGGHCPRARQLRGGFDVGKLGLMRLFGKSRRLGGLRGQQKAGAGADTRGGMGGARQRCRGQDARFARGETGSTAGRLASPAPRPSPQVGRPRRHTAHALAGGAATTHAGRGPATGEGGRWSLPAGPVGRRGALRRTTSCNRRVPLCASAPNATGTPRYRQCNCTAQMGAQTPANILPSCAARAGPT